MSMSLEQRNRLAMENIRLATHVAMKGWRQGWAKKIGTFHDVLQEATIGLLEAVERLRDGPSQGAFLSKSIRFYLIEAANRNRGGLIHIAYGGNSSPELDQQRRQAEKRSERMFAINDEMDGHKHTPGPDALAEKADLEEYVLGMLDKLDDPRSEAIRLSFGVQGCKKESHREIAGKMGCSRTKVDTLIRSGLTTLRELTKKEA
jgi:RNA polymerase sigma factor (sigma-70 family)